MSPAVRHLFRTRTDSFFNVGLASLGFIPRIYETLDKYDLFHDFQLWFSESIFPCYERLFCYWGDFTSPSIKQLPLSLSDFCPLLFLKFTGGGWKAAGAMAYSLTLLYSLSQYTPFRNASFIVCLFFLFNRNFL